LTGDGDVETYVLANGAGNDFTLGANGQSVTGAAGQNDDIGTGATTTLTGSIDGGTGQTDTLYVEGNVNVTSATLTSLEVIEIGDGFALTAKASQITGVTVKSTRAGANDGALVVTDFVTGTVYDFDSVDPNGGITLNRVTGEDDNTSTITLGTSATAYTLSGNAAADGQFIFTLESATPATATTVISGFSSERYYDAGSSSFITRESNDYDKLSLSDFIGTKLPSGTLSFASVGSADTVIAAGTDVIAFRTGSATNEADLVTDFAADGGATYMNLGANDLNSLFAADSQVVLAINNGAGGTGIWYWDDSNEAGGTGNGDGILDVGEVILLATLNNVDGEDLTANNFTLA
jgi:hypothetical protein